MDHSSVTALLHSLPWSLDLSQCGSSQLPINGHVDVDSFTVKGEAAVERQ